MKIKTIMPLVLLLALSAVALPASAQEPYGQSPSDTTTTSSGQSYSIPNGYQSYNYGIYYNSNTGVYYNPRTGQYSATAPMGPASTTNGFYDIPSGYTGSTYGTYYSSSTARYYDPVSGFYSTTPPLGPTFAQATPGTGTTPTTTPGLPNTGAGGEAALTVALLLSSAFLGLLSVRIFMLNRRRSLK